MARLRQPARPSPARPEPSNVEASTGAPEARLPGAPWLRTYGWLRDTLLPIGTRRRRVVGRAKRWATDVPAGPGTASYDFARRAPGALSLRTRAATERLYAKLDARDEAELAARLVDQDLAILNAASGPDRQALLLTFAVDYGVRAILEKTGLTDAAPPPEVHAMHRGRLSAGGSYYHADLVVDALTGAGAALDAGSRVLDFGCSSGRVVRVLGAAFPEVEWHGCDPIEASITWAAKHLPGVRFATSTREPPLTYPDGFFDVAFAISIWSHFSERAALRWLTEMRRVIRPSGSLLLTTHGYESIAHYARRVLRPRAQLVEIATALYTDGYWFKNEFGDGGDGGLGGTDWGTTFMTAEWLLPRVCPGWRLSYLAPGLLEGNQDVFVLERR